MESPCARSFVAAWFHRAGAAGLALLAMFILLTPPASAAPGDLDPLNANVVGSAVNATAMQPDGKIILVGSFTSVLGVPRSNVARLNADGTLDMSFDPRTNNLVYSVAVQADGKVLLGGGFTTLQPYGAGAATARNYIARVNANGTLDPGFDPKANDWVYSVAEQADGKVLLGGWFTMLQPNGAGAATARQRIARVNADGTLDPGFDPQANGNVLNVAVQADGKVLLGGLFTTLQPNGAGAATARNYVARVNADGTLDPGFDPKANSTVSSVAVQADGKLLLGGVFTTLQPNGAGAATARQRIARVNADGTLDPGFDPKANDYVNSVVVQADGKVLLGGRFTTLQPNGAGASTARNCFARLVNDPATQTLTAPDATQALWQRGGAAPELSRVTFELSTNGGATWGAPIAGTRIGITPNWQRTGLSLPASGHLRARGATTGGYFNGSSGLIEQVIPFSFPLPPYSQWKLTNLGDANAPDTGNPDADAFLNIAEYGLVLSPTIFSAGPESGGFTYPEGERLRIVFTRDPTRHDVTIEVLAADDLAGPWTTVASSVLGAVTSGEGYFGGDSPGPGVKTVEVRDLYNVGDPAHPRRFLRLQVSR